MREHDTRSEKIQAQYVIEVVLKRRSITRILHSQTGTLLQVPHVNVDPFRSLFGFPGALKWVLDWPHNRKGWSKSDSSQRSSSEGSAIFIFFLLRKSSLDTLSAERGARSREPGPGGWKACSLFSKVGPTNPRWLQIKFAQQSLIRVQLVYGPICVTFDYTTLLFIAPRYITYIHCYIHRHIGT